MKIINLSKKYGSNQVLNKINLSIEQGSIYGIVGLNGSGKTTLLKCIAGHESHEGEIIIPEWLNAKKVSLLETNPLLITKITGWEYLKLICIARKNDFEYFEKANIFDLPLQEYASSYSTGMKKKLALTGILLQHDDLLLLDEPFSGIDIQSNILIQDLLTKLKSKGSTIIISSHTFGTLENICDKIVHLTKEGKCILLQPDQFGTLEKELSQSIVEEHQQYMDYFIKD